MRDNHQLVDIRRGKRADAAEEDLLAGQPEKLLRNLAAKSVPGAACQKNGGDEQDAPPRKAPVVGQ